MSAKTKTEYLRNFIFGVEDSLVSTIGLVSGVAAAGMTGKTVFLTGMVLIFVESFSMGVGSLLSENSAEEYQEQKTVALSKDLGYALVMFLSYLLSGLALVLPYAFASIGTATKISICLALVGLFFLGVGSGKAAGNSPLKKGVLMATLGGFTILLGVVVGSLVEKLRY